MKHILITRILPVFLAGTVCLLLFLSWGRIRLGGEFKIGDDYTNPIVVEGGYPHGFAKAVKTFSDELNGFQEKAELLSLVLMSLCVFLCVLEVFYAVCCLLDIRMRRAMGLTAEIAILLTAAVFLIFAVIYKDGAIAFGNYFRITTEISLNASLFLIIICEVAGKQLLPAIAKAHKI